MIRFSAKLKKQNKPGGWTYLIVSAALIHKLKPGKKSFRVKGTFNQFRYTRVTLLSLGNGSYLLPFNASMRKGTGKKEGDKVAVVMALDQSKPKLSPDLLQCLKEDTVAMGYFKTLTPFFQRLYSSWIESAKTSQTKTRRLVALVNSLSQKQGYQEVMKAYKNTIL
ncbi:MAG TPA: YdeI/OmpD-associated family protein [Cyclobacteriaceae bacterium]|nr:DUF1905 domain-containing protein [Cytophagales bacterium]HMR56994.1 YdeI/OmpD-associated family protein [Cyclobacteriaceae bacterium]HNT50608.1 YdeI/OmpD-associated family protein [Cyclobacteriaceae bacterium]HRE67619.1 YdeI/OmpD-associated family protein [Cyclobacteriaceae bacterium]HRF33772.1 YdeI/OmpD-associated family protein [Cyclobacteriaceae bacterium]